MIKRKQLKIEYKDDSLCELCYNFAFFLERAYRNLFKECKLDYKPKKFDKGNTSFFSYFKVEGE